MKQKFEPYAETYLSMATDGFPNYFMMLGPNAAVGTGTLTTMIEMTGDYIVKCIRKLQKENIKSMEVQKRKVKDFSDFIVHYFKKTVYMDNCSSWYISPGGSVTALRAFGLVAPSTRWNACALHVGRTLITPMTMRTAKSKAIASGGLEVVGQLRRLLLEKAK